MNDALFSYPPSFVILYLLDFSLIIGSSISVPSKDHVPQLKNTKSFSVVGTDTNAL